MWSEIPVRAVIGYDHTALQESALVLGTDFLSVSIYTHYCRRQSVHEPCMLTSRSLTDKMVVISARVPSHYRETQIWTHQALIVSSRIMIFSQ